MKLMIIIITSLFVAQCIVEVAAAAANQISQTPDMEQNLLNALFKNYNKKLKPLGTVEVKFALNLNQIVNLIEKDQIIVLNVFLDHEWTDNRLRWNPAEHNNISILRVSSDLVWTFVYTTADQSGFLMPQSGSYFIIQHQGLIFWPNPLTQMKLRCRMTIGYFPYDQQLCVMVFGSWSHTSTYLNYTLIEENPSLQNYTENNEWHLIDFKPFRALIKYENWVENDKFTEISYKLLIQRKSLFVVQNFVFPALMLCILTLVSFFIPFPQEMQIGISILLSFAVFKLRLSDDVPVQSDSIPLINIYFTLCMSFCLSAMVWFSIVNKIKESKENMPAFVRLLVVRYISCIFKANNEAKVSQKVEDPKPDDSKMKFIDSTINITRKSEYSPTKAIPESTSMLSEFDFKKSLSIEFNNTTGTVKNITISQPAPPPIVEQQQLLPRPLSDAQIIELLNQFVFTLFFLFIIVLNLLCLYLLPFVFRTSLTIND